MTDVGDFIISDASAPAAPIPISVPDDTYGSPEYQDFASYLHQNRSVKLPLIPGTQSIQTDNEEEQCIMCFRNKSTLRLHPCGHKVMCPECYTKMEKGECPICRSSITKLTCENL
jgi:hypothetical protein